MNATHTIDASAQIRDAIVSKIADAKVQVKMNGDRHYSIAVTSSEFAGQSMLQSHKKVMSALAALMDGDDAQVHAVDSLKTSAT
jgi:stress-induced morphogen